MGLPVFPTMPGITFPVERDEEVQGTDLQAYSGRKTWLPNWPWPLYHYVVTFSLLRSSAAFQEWQTFRGFWNAVKTSPGGYFYYSDPNDNFATSQPIGEGDGVTTTFQPIRALGGFAEPILGAYTDSNPATSIVDFGSVTTSATAFVDYGSVASAATAFVDYSSTPISNTHFYVNGVEVSATLNPDTGLADFAIAPPNGQLITWTGPYYWLCQFEDTTVSISNFMYQMFELNKLKFMTARL